MAGSLVGRKYYYIQNQSRFRQQSDHWKTIHTKNAVSAIFTTRLVLKAQALAKNQDLI